MKRMRTKLLGTVSYDAIVRGWIDAWKNRDMNWDRPVT